MVRTDSLNIMKNLYLAVQVAKAEILMYYIRYPMRGMVFFIATIGGAIGAPMAGRIFDVTSSYSLAFLICALVSFFGTILTLFLKPITLKEGVNDARRST